MYVVQYKKKFWLSKILMYIWAISQIEFTLYKKFSYSEALFGFYRLTTP